MPGSEPDEDLMTIDDLARRTGVTVRTVRFYAGEGLLPAPIRRGRVAYYDASHRTRLEFARELQDYGFSLSRIRQCLARIPPNATPGDLAVHRALLTPWQPPEELDVDRAELERLAGRALGEAELATLTGLTLVVRTADDRFRVSPSALAVGVELLDLPVPTRFLRQAATVIDGHAGAVADELSDLFRGELWADFRDGARTDQEAARLARVVEQLRPLAIRCLVLAFERAADRALASSTRDRPSE
ncbi:MerR family transcriptional regulator [Streptomyces sp. 8K308]|uniref:MerR family transcriptional regulator n=1 Tax=Streptomyces sp. 8K308 TaxID=2530388 RepID=UPI00104A4830|nr:MerR family transcriptional regulator [Streptomyces sp. 8K308]TDC27457.1 MerR family transcriptional regulator [Streptomyces sp. 8K308]